MYLSKLKIGLAVVLAVCIAGTGAGLVWQQVPSARPVEVHGPEPDAGWLTKPAAALSPTQQNPASIATATRYRRTP